MIVSTIIHVLSSIRAFATRTWGPFTKCFCYVLLTGRRLNVPCRNGSGKIVRADWHALFAKLARGELSIGAKQSESTPRWAGCDFLASTNTHQTATNRTRKKSWRWRRRQWWYDIGAAPGRAYCRFSFGCCDRRCGISIYKLTNNPISVSFYL